MWPDSLYDLFSKLYGEGEKPRLFFAPGRVNLIGEHIDYNGGYVFPAALTLGNYVLIRKNGTDRIRVAAEDLPGTLVDCAISELESRKGKAWGSYQLGVCYELLQAGYPVPGCDMLFYSDLPFGAGLSSSASIEVATLVAVLGLSGVKIDMTEAALIAQRAENYFVGVNCGIMDQFASANGQADCGMLLDCSTLECEQVKLNLSGYSIVIANTNKKRGLADSKYNERRSECEAALEVLKTVYPGLRNLCELSYEQVFAQLKLLKERLGEEKGTFAGFRALHAAGENERVLNAVKALKARDVKAFGGLLKASHESLRDLYEVTGRELDSIVKFANLCGFCIGSRMTGAGFGGCSVSVVESGRISEFIGFVKENYMRETGLTPDFYISEAGRGAHEIV